MKNEKSLKNNDSYDTDFFGWTQKQACYLKEENYSCLDIMNLAEEIESLGRSEKRTLQSHLKKLMLHMLKVKFQPGKHTRSWDLSIKQSRLESKQTLDENPSLKPKLKNIINDSYFTARLAAAQETEIDENIFPEHCPWNVNDIFPDLEKKYLT